MVIAGSSSLLISGEDATRGPADQFDEIKTKFSAFFSFVFFVSLSFCVEKQTAPFDFALSKTANIAYRRRCWNWDSVGSTIAIENDIEFCVGCDRCDRCAHGVCRVLIESYGWTRRLGETGRRCSGFRLRRRRAISFMNFIHKNRRFVNE